MASTQYHPLYLKGIEHFNACDFYESHEVWEDLWKDYQGPDRKFYQGLIQVAVALHHFGNGNIGGARKLYHSSRSYLQSYRPHHLGLDLEKLFAEMEACFAEILASDDPRAVVAIRPELIPEIHLDPPG
jgi:predicted metal-dependent hydrolase